MLPESNQKPSNQFLETILEWLVAPHHSVTDFGDIKRARLASGLALTLIIVYLFALLWIVLNKASGSSTNIFIFAIIASTIAYAITRTQLFTVGAFLLVVFFCAAGYADIVIAHKGIEFSILFYVPLALTIGSVLLSSWILLLVLALNIAAIFFLLPIFGVQLLTSVYGVAGLITIFTVMLIILNNFRKGVERQRLEELQKTNQEFLDIRSHLEERVTKRTNELNRRSTQLEAASLVTRAAAEIRGQKALLETIVQQISERFGFYHTGIFLTDPNGEYILLEAASSDGGKLMIQRGHKLTIGRQGIVGFTAYQKRPRIAQDVGADAIFFTNPDLPETHSEMALPLLARNRLVGVLDIQSKEHNAFSNEDISTLQIMADQIALTIENARLLNESRSAIDELQNITSENISGTWKERLAQTKKGYAYSSTGITAITSTSKEKSGSAEARGHSIKIPVSLRGQRIGELTLTRKINETPWTEAEQEMADKIAIQIALAIENARLLEESQRRALREQAVNDLSSRFSRSLDVDTLLQNAVRELHRIPLVSEVSVYITPDETIENSNKSTETK